MSKKLNINDFIKRSELIHINKYDYSLVEYVNNKTKVDIICPKHGKFKQTPKNHLINKAGCPIYKESKGEKHIRLYLLERGIKFIPQYRFDNCKNKSQLPFDFYLPEYNICIEYDGMQHYKPIKYFGGVNGFYNIKTNDNIKTNYCLNNNIKLIRVDYKNNNIKGFLKKVLNERKG